MMAVGMAVIMALLGATEGAEMEQLEATFATPPNPYRPYQIIHDADHFAMGKAPDTSGDKAQQFRSSAKHMKEVGLGGAVININYSNGLDDAAQWDWFRTKFNILREEGMGVWLYDEKGFPSGMAGGATIEGNPEYRAMGLVCDVSIVGGPDKLKIDKPDAAGQIVACRAYRKRGDTIDLSESIAVPMGLDAKLEWSVPAGNWEVWLFYTHYLDDSASVFAGLPGHEPYINIMDKEAVAKFIRLTHENYAKHLGNDLEAVEAIFTDEPALHTVPGFAGPEQMPVMVPWARDFVEVFRAQHGYDIRESLPALYRELGPESMRIRYDFWETVSNRIGDTFFGQIREWCEAHGIDSSGHLLAEEGLLRHVTTQGSLFTALREMNLVGIDMLCSSSEYIFANPDANWFMAAVYPASVNHIYDRNGVMCEISALMDLLQRVENWTSKGWYNAMMEALRTQPDDFVGIEHITGSAGLLCALGVTHFESYQSKFTSETYRKYGEFIGRLEVMMREAKPAGKLAVLYPIGSLWANYLPDGKAPEQSAQNESVRRTESQTLQLAKQLLEHQINFDFIDEDSLHRAWQNESGEIAVGKGAYRGLVLPPMTYMKESTQARILELEGQGLAVYALGERPQWIQDGREVKAADWPGSFGLLDDVPKLITVLEEEGYPEVQLEPANPKVVVAHRVRDEGELYLFVNTTEDKAALDVGIRKTGKVTLWNPESGAVSRPEGLKVTDAEIRFPLHLDRFGCRMILVEQNKE